MKKRNSLLLALPLLLGGAVFWARDAAWRANEAQFQRAVASLWGEGTYVVVTASAFKNQRNFRGQWDQIQWRAAFSQLRLQRASADFPRGKPGLTILFNDGGSVGEQWGFTLSQSEDRGRIHLPPPNEEWNAYELAPETCRALKRRTATLKVESQGVTDG